MVTHDEFDWVNAIQLLRQFILNCQYLILKFQQFSTNINISFFSKYVKSIMILFTYWQFLEIADIEFMIILVKCIVEFFTGLWSIMIVSGIKVGNVFISFRATQKKSSRLQVMLSVSTIKASIVQYWHLYCCLCRWLKSVLTFLIYILRVY